MEEVKEKLFTEKQVNVSAFLAGPIPPGILIYKNYKALGEDRKANLVLGVTLLITIGLFYGIMQIPEEVMNKVPNFLFSFLYGLIVFVFFRNFMAKEVNEALGSGTEKRSNWSVVGTALVGLVLNAVIILAIAVDQPFYSGDMIEKNGNQLYYDENISKEDADKLVRHFESEDFFGADYGNIARLQMINEDYVITMYMDSQLWDDVNTISYVTNIKQSMEVEFGRATFLKLESASLAGPEYKLIED